MIASLQHLARFIAGRPLVRLALAAATGAVMAARLPVPFPWLAAITLASSLVWLAARSSRSLRLPSLFLCTSLFACCLSLLHPASRATAASLPEGPVTIRGTIRTDPSIRPVRDGHAWLWTFELKEWIAANHPSPVNRTPLAVAWFAPAQAQGPCFGETWSFEGTCRSSRKDRVIQVVSAKRESRRLARREGSSLAAHCYAGRHAAEACLSRGMENHRESAAILNALLLGYRGHLTAESREVFTATGTLHIFAISGLHVGIVALLITCILRGARVPRTSWVLIIAPLLIIYTLGTGARPSAVRACIMAIALFLAPLLGRRPDPACALALAAILLLAWDPRTIQDIGFIYTFVVVIGLLILTPRLEAPLRRLYHSADADLVSRNARRAMSRAQTWRERADMAWRRVLRGFCGLAALSCAAWIVSAPLTAYWFGRAAPVALLANIIVVPITFAIVLAGCLSVLCGACVPFLSLGVNSVNVLMIGLLFRVLRLCTALPLASMEISPPPLWGVLLWYAGIGLVVMIRPPPAARTPRMNQER